LENSLRVGQVKKLIKNLFRLLSKEARVLLDEEEFLFPLKL